MSPFTPLKNIRILDLTRLLPGAVCTMMMQQLGAEVIKVEAPDGGDYARWMPPLIDGHGALFYATNRGKQSIVLNLKDERGQAVLKRLVVDADVLIEGNRPGVMQRLNCDYESLRQVNPRLVYCSLSGWGQSGPFTHKSGHDLNYIAQAGLLPDDATSPPGGQIADIGGAYMAMNMIMAALLQRTQTGEGAYLDVSLFESSLMFALQPLVESMAASSSDFVPGLLTGAYACYNVYYSQDGVALTLAALEEKFWRNFAHAVERPDLLDGDYMDGERQAMLKQQLAELFASRPAAEWRALLDEADCCFAVATPLADVPDNPHIQTRGHISLDAKGLPILSLLPDAESIPDTRPPAYGEHTRCILQDAGYSEQAIDDLSASNIIAFFTHDRH